MRISSLVLSMSSRPEGNDADTKSNIVVEVTVSRQVDPPRSHSVKGYISPERRPSEITITTLSSFIIRYSTIPSTLRLALRRSRHAPNRPSVNGIRAVRTTAFLHLHARRAKRSIGGGERHLADATTNVMGYTHVYPRDKWFINSNFKIWPSFYGMVDERQGTDYSIATPECRLTAAAPRSPRNVFRASSPYYLIICDLRCNGIIMSAAARTETKSAAQSSTRPYDSGVPNNS
jgi:hypothetical protein